MSNAASSLLECCRALGIDLWAEDGRLCYDAPAGALTPELRAELMARKAEVLALLAEGGSAPSAPAPLGDPDIFSRTLAAHVDLVEGRTPDGRWLWAAGDFSPESLTGVTAADIRRAQDDAPPGRRRLARPDLIHRRTPTPEPVELATR